MQDFVIILAAVVVIIPLFAYLHLPSLVGFLITGVLIGPHGLGLVHTVENVATLAEVGVVLLLFTIGLEFPVHRLMQLRKYMLAGGGLQVLSTVVMMTAVFSLAGFSVSQALIFGFLISLSSTAIVMKILIDRRETNSPQGRIALGILIFQDLSFVPIMLGLPLLAQSGGQTLGGIMLRLALSLLLIVVIVAGGRFLIPLLLNQIIRLRIRELFVLALVLISLGTAWLTSLVGLSLALGAFVAGLVLSESEYSHQIFSEVLPLRDVLGSLFFISIGMLLDVQMAAEIPAFLFGTTMGLIGVKCLIILVVLAFLKVPLRVAALVGLALAQVGEFSFILSHEAMAQGIFTARIYQYILAVTILTLILTPIIIQYGSPAVGFLLRRFPKLSREEDDESGTVLTPQKGHVVIIGYGVNGKNVATVLKETGIPYVILDLDPLRVRSARAEGESIVYGDGTRMAILSQLHVETARVLVIAFSDPDSTRRIVRAARSLSSNLHIIVRTHYLNEMEELYSLGANQVIPEEFETSIEIFTRVLREYHVPRNVIAAQVDLLRRSHYSMMRGLKLPDTTVGQLAAILAAGTTDTFLVLNESSAAHKTLQELDLRGNSGVTVIAVVRKEHPMTNPSPDFRIETGDVLVLMGNHAQVDAAFDFLSTQPPTPTR